MVSLPPDVGDDFDGSLPQPVDEDVYWDMDAKGELDVILPDQVVLPDDVDMGECSEEMTETEAQGGTSQTFKVFKIPLHLQGRDAVMEVFSPPRLVPVAKGLGLTSSVSLDSAHGWDADKPQDREQAFTILKSKRPWLLAICPECTMFSILMRNCNIAKMDQQTVKQRMIVAVDHVNFSMDMCKEQAQLGGKFIFEHPAGASSWTLKSVRDVIESVPGCDVASFPQCAYGLCNPSTGEPWRKNTKFLTNSMAVMDEFGKAKCRCAVPHDTIQGNVNGQKESRLAQVYPPKLVQAMVQCCMKGT